MKMINLGCGDKFHNDFVNVDLISNHPNVVTCNFLNGIPFSDNHFDFAYHSHVLEHFSQADGRLFLQECHRILKVGGVLRIAVPDLENIIRNYLQALEASLSGVTLADYNYDWMMLELYDQAVRTTGGGNMGKYLTQVTVKNEDFVRSRIGTFYDFIRLSHNTNHPNISLRSRLKTLMPTPLWNFF
jgi:predicted SAM-dependent methyltransferase